MAKRTATKSKATLHDVASAAGVSIATASKALNGVSVSRPNKDKVMEAADRLGYVVNETARSLRSKLTQTVGLIFHELTTARGVGLLDAMSASLESAGYSLLCATARADAAAYDLLMRRFLERRVDGLFCVTPPALLPSVRRYMSAGIPILAITDRSDALAAHPLVKPSINVSGQNAMTDIVRLGHTHIVSLDDGSTRPSLGTIDPRWTRAIGIELVHLRDIGGLDLFVQRLLERKNRPTLISAFEAQAETLLAICRASAIRVPEDLSIIAITQSTNEKRAAELNLASVCLSPQLLGQEAATQMLQLLGGQRVQKDISVEIGSWTLRGSLGKARG